MPRKDKKLILVRKDLLDKVFAITTAEGRTVLSFTNEVFEQALKAYAMQTKPAEIVEFYSLIGEACNSGALIPIPSEALNYMVSKLYRTDQENLFKIWYDSGFWYGKYLYAKFHKHSGLDIFQRIANSFGLFNIWTEKINENKINIWCVSAKLNDENTQTWSKFIEGLLSSLDYKVLKNKCTRGIIQIKAGKKEVSED